MHTYILDYNDALCYNRYMNNTKQNKKGDNEMANKNCGNSRQRSALKLLERALNLLDGTDDYHADCIEAIIVTMEDDMRSPNNPKPEGE